MKWLTININPPKLDVVIVARSTDEFGYGAHHEVFTFDSRTFTEDEVVMFLQNRSFIEWIEIPK